MSAILEQTCGQHKQLEMFFKLLITTQQNKVLRSAIFQVKTQTHDTNG